jgi:hypothetical protein
MTFNAKERPGVPEKGNAMQVNRYGQMENFTELSRDTGIGTICSEEILRFNNIFFVDQTI